MDLDINKITLGDKFGVNFEADETIRLICTPNLKGSIFNEVRNILLQFLFFAGAIAIMQIIAYLFKAPVQWKITIVFFGIVSLFLFGTATRTILKLRTTTYLITNISIIIHSDFYNSSTKTINIKDIKTKELKKTIVDKYLGTGTIKIFTGETENNEGKTEKIYDNINSVLEPEKAFVLL